MTVSMLLQSNLSFILQLRELPLRHFNRMFVVVPQGSGFCIVNEMLHVTLPTAKQADVCGTLNELWYENFVNC